PPMTTDPLATTVPDHWFSFCPACTRPVEDGDGYCCWCGAELAERLQRRPRTCPHCHMPVRPWGDHCPLRRGRRAPPAPPRPPPADASARAPPPAERPGGAPTANRYRVLERIGRGGMGTTYKAEDAATGAVVCLKQLRPGTDPRAVEQECRALKHLEHPNI